ncbi:hypothetical protein [Psychrobacillus sp.]|uniref:hypothetical protein n=1 Tax=Psychrobacillus sp. TaxID=1871623 RepID=UPI0028BEFC7A|nr:hypothetical protein [Psychrobacillus sp.]
MSGKLIKTEQKTKEEIHITYYFTALFMVIGTLSILYILSFRVEKLNIFTLLLAISAGGLPIGVIGAFIDYKVSEYRIKYDKIV